MLAEGQLPALAAAAKEHWPVAAFSVGQKYVDHPGQSTGQLRSVGVMAVEQEPDGSAAGFSFGPLWIQFAGFLLQK